MNNKLWSKGFDINKRIEKFTVGKDREMDIMLARWDVIGTIAHIKMLEKINVITQDEFIILKKELLKILDKINLNEFIIEPDVEDVHSQVELMLINKLGEIGKKIHTARSRNDQVLLDLKLFIRDNIKSIVIGVYDLFLKFIEMSEKYKSVMMPGYTHYQVAMPSSFGLWFGSYAESLMDDLIILESAFRITNKNPLGSAAGYGSTFPIDRELTTELLGFDTLNYNSIYAQMGRGKVERCVSQAIASIGSTIGKFAQDVTLFSNQNYNFIKLPDYMTTGSSIMPHKKNPDVFELVRAKTNRLNSLSNEILLITSNLSHGYHRDLQILKESFIPSFSDLLDCIQITDYSIGNIEINKNILNETDYNYLFSVESMNKLVLDGETFRDSYIKIADRIKSGELFNKPENLNYTHVGSIGNLSNEKISQEMKKIIDKFEFDKIDNAIEKLLG